MRETEGIIERVWQIAPTIQRIELTIEPALSQLKPGQSVLALTNENWQPYLREQWFPVSIQEKRMVIERQMKFHYIPGQTVSLLGPVGNPFPWIGGAGKQLLLIAQDTSPAPLLWLGQDAINQAASVALILSGDDARKYPLSAVPAAMEVVIDGNSAANPKNQEKPYSYLADKELLTWAQQIFAIVNPGFWQDSCMALFQAIKQARYNTIPVNFLYGVINMSVPCGTGVCMACMVRCKTANKLICKEGPALDLTEVLL